MRCLLGVLILGLLALPAAAVPTVDGVLDAEYGLPLAVQAVQTQFGDEGAGCDDCGGELDAAYATISGGRLYLMITGNLEGDNFNKLDIFIDSLAGGENVMSGTPQYDFSPSAGFWISQNLAGMTFDVIFDADYHLFSRAGGGNYEVDFVNRQGGGNAQVPGASQGAATSGGAGAQTATGFVPAGDLGPNALVSSLSQNLDFGFNNTNNAGVTGGTAAANLAAAAAVTTGMEYSIALADIGNPGLGSTILIAAMYSNGDHNYLSNQILGPLVPPKGNLGANGSGGGGSNLSGINFDEGTNADPAMVGPQFFSIVVVPEPSSLVLVGLALVGLAGFARRRK